MYIYIYICIYVDILMYLPLRYQMGRSKDVFLSHICRYSLNQADTNQAFAGSGFPHAQGMFD